MRAPATPTTITMSVLLDSRRRIAGVSKPSGYRPAKGGDEPEVTTGLVAGPGQSMVEVEVPGDFADLDGVELLSRLAEQPALRMAMANSTTTGQAPTTGQARTAGDRPTAGQSPTTGPVDLGDIAKFDHGGNGVRINIIINT